jgi:hypothetical protein
MAKTSIYLFPKLDDETTIAKSVIAALYLS